MGLVVDAYGKEAVKSFAQLAFRLAISPAPSQGLLTSSHVI